MKLDKLTKYERQVIFECLAAIVNGPFIPNSLFHTLIGEEKSEYEILLDNYTNGKMLTGNDNLKIYRAIQQLLEYPHGKENFWSEYISESIENVRSIFFKFTGDDISKKQKEVWNGIVQGYFTPRAEIVWNKFEKSKQKQLLTSVWCPNCSQYTTITNYEGGLNESGQISIYGKCVLCFNQIEKIVNDEE